MKPNNSKLVDIGSLLYAAAYSVEQWKEDSAPLLFKWSGAVLCGDSKGEGVRREKYPFYKGERATRDLTEEDKWLKVEVNSLRSWITSHPSLNYIGVNGYEADDIIAALYYLAEKKPQIVSNDKDLLTVSEDVLRINGTPLTMTVQHTLRDVVASPQQRLLYLSLVGDRSDSIPRLIPNGIKGLKGARGLFESTTPFTSAYEQYGEGFIANLELALIPHIRFVGFREFPVSLLPVLDSWQWEEYVKQHIVPKALESLKIRG